MTEPTPDQPEPWLVRVTWIRTLWLRRLVILLLYPLLTLLGLALIGVGIVRAVVSGQVTLIRSGIQAWNAPPPEG